MAFIYKIFLELDFLKIEVLVSTMNQADISLVEKMNIQTDSIVVNQTSSHDYFEDIIKGNKIRMYSFNERGVGLSRNNALMRSDADICLMADDDMIYVDGYEEMVINAFNNNPKADIIMFNVPIHKKNGQTIVKIKKDSRVRFTNALKYGTVNLAFKREAIIKKNIYFSLLFGGGARYGSGEDSLFIKDALKHWLKIYASKEIIAVTEENESTWFTGYNEKYFFDRGALFQAIGEKGLSFLLMVQFIIRKKKLYSNQLSPLCAFKEMSKGRKHYLEKTRLK